MSRTIFCEICGVEATATGSKQRTCKAKECRLRLRAITRAKRYYAIRKTPICVWCFKPIHEPRKRQYHARCWADKNRDRVAVYDMLHAKKPGPKKPRDFKASLRCRRCKKRVKRTSARQIICLDIECKRWLKNLRKRQRLQERRTLSARIEKVRKEKIRKASMTPAQRVYKVTL